MQALLLTSPFSPFRQRLSLGLPVMRSVLHLIPLRSEPPAFLLRLPRQAPASPANRANSVCKGTRPPPACFGGPPGARAGEGQGAGRGFFCIAERIYCARLPTRMTLSTVAGLQCLACLLVCGVRAVSSLLGALTQRLRRLIMESHGERWEPSCGAGFCAAAKLLLLLGFPLRLGSLLLYHMPSKSVLLGG